MTWKGYLVVAAGFLVAALVIVSLPTGLLPQASASTSTSTTQTVNLTVNQTITLTLGSSTFSLPALTPGTPVIATSSATVTTNASNGWNLQVSRVSATSTIASGTIIFPDATSFNGSNATSSANVGANLSFRAYQTGTSAGIYNSTTWGTNDSDPNALYAGFPTSSQTFASTSTYTGAAQTVVFEIRANSPATQVATNYTGSITITAVALP